MTKIILRRYNIYSECATYCTSQKQLNIFLANSPSQVKVSGFYSYIGSILVKIFRLDDSPILLEIGENRYVFEDLKITTCDVDRIRDDYKIFQKRRIVIQEHERIVFDTDYDEIEVTFENDPTPMIEDEDFDFGLFLESISNNRVRQKLLWDMWKIEKS